jgi:methionine-rich copper-binding protein CopC
MRVARLPVLALALVLALLPVPAAAHPLLVGATPSSGTSAATPPARIVLSFTEVLDPVLSSVVLVAPDGRTTPWPSTVSGGTLEVGLPALPAGTWRVRWAVSGSDGGRESGDYRFTVATPPPTGGPGPVERGGRAALLLLGVILAGLLLGGAALPSDPRRRPAAGRRIAGLRATVWGLTLLSLLGSIAGLVAAGGWPVLLTSPAGAPLLAAAGVTVALGVAVFDGGALSSGEVASPPTRLLGVGLGAVLLAALVAVEEAPGGDAASAVAGALALSALAAVAGAAIATVATAGASDARRAGLARLLPRTVVGLALLGAAAALRPDALTAAAAIAGALVAAVVLVGGGAFRGRPRHRPAAAAPPRAISLPGRAEPRLGRPAAAAPGRPPARDVPEPDPLPAGMPVHQRLSGHFVDLVRLLESLEWSGFTGYVRVDGAAPGVLVLVAGELGAARVEDATPTTGDEAVRQLASEVTDGEAMIDVVGLDPETARAVVDLLSAPPLFTGLGARMVNIDGVLDDLGERRRDGSLVVRAPNDTGVILVRRGGVHGAYTRILPHLDDSPGAVAALAESPGALVEVRIAPPPSVEEGEADRDVEAPQRGHGAPFWDRYCEARHVSGLD